MQTVKRINRATSHTTTVQEEMSRDTSKYDFSTSKFAYMALQSSSKPTTYWRDYHSDLDDYKQ